MQLNCTIHRPQGNITCTVKRPAAPASGVKSRQVRRVSMLAPSAER